MDLKNLTKKQKIIIGTVAGLFVLGGIASVLYPDKPIVEGLVKIDTQVCRSEYSCIDYKANDIIFLQENDEGSYTVYDKAENGYSKGNIAADKVVIKGSEDYDKFVKDFAEFQKAKEEVLAKANAEKLAQLEPAINKAYKKIDIRKFQEDGNGIYEFYVDPIVWLKLNVDEKKNAFNNAMTYAQLKTNSKDASAVKYGTKIKNFSNGAVLAEYTLTKGINLK